MPVLKIVFSAAAALALLVAGLVTYGGWKSAHTLYPSVQNESAFLRTYDPKVALMPFIYELHGYTEPGGIGGGGGTRFVVHIANYGEYFSIRADRKDALLSAVREDVAHRLRVTGARILAQSGTPSTGFHFDYALANTIGSVAIQSLQPEAVHRNLALPKGLEDESLNIAVEEEWFPRGIPRGVPRLLPESDR